MEEETLLKKILNFFLHVFLAIISFFRKLFGKDVKVNKVIIKEEEKIEPKKEEKISNVDPTTLPDTANVNANNHDSTDNGNKDDDVILKLTNEDLEKIKLRDAKYILSSADELDRLINECLEEEYKEEELKIKKAPKELKEKIKEFKEEIIYIIKKNATKKQIETREVLKEEIKEIIKEEIKEKPLMPKLEDLRKQKEVDPKDVYFLAEPLRKGLNIKKPVIQMPKQEVVLTTPDKEEIKAKIEEKPYFMVQNVDEIPKEDFKEEVKKAAIVGGMLGTKAVLDIVTPLPKEEKEESLTVNRELKLDEEKPKVINAENVLEAEIVLPKLKELEEQLDTIKEQKKDIPITKKENKERNENIPKVEEQTKEAITKEEVQPEVMAEEVSLPKEESLKEEKIIDKIDSSILEITLASSSIIASAKEETEKKELEEKDYDKKEEQINKMLDDIEVTLLKYDGKMSEKQKKKLKKEQDRLRDSKDNLATKKQEDIDREAYLLDETIKEVELTGVQNELRRLHTENQLEMNETLLNRINGLENLTQEQIANIDKKMLMKRLNKVSALMEMSSILALPFIRNKYFFYFTIGLIIDNHFNFINAFFKRRINRYEPANLDQIKQGEDALNSALNMTYKNQVQLEYVVNEALTRYPELANDPLFTNKVNNLRMQLEHSYQKMINKKNTMEKYHRKTKSQIKVLKRTGDLEEAA